MLLKTLPGLWNWQMTLDVCPGGCSHEYCVVGEITGPFNELWPKALAYKDQGYGVTLFYGPTGLQIEVLDAAGLVKSSDYHG